MVWERLHYIKMDIISVSLFLSETQQACFWKQLLPLILRSATFLLGFLTPRNVLNSLCKCFSLFVLLAGYFELPQAEEEGEEQEVGPGLPSTKKGAGSLAEEGTFIQTDR